MKKPKFSLVRHDDAMEELVRSTDKRTLAVWAIDCAERVMPYFEEAFPDDPRPAQQPVQQDRQWQRPMSPGIPWVQRSMPSRQSGERSNRKMPRQQLQKNGTGSTGGWWN